MARAAKVEVLILLIHVCGCNLSLHERKDIFRGCTQASVFFKSQVDKVFRPTFAASLRYRKTFSLDTEIRRREIEKFRNSTVSGGTLGFCAKKLLFMFFSNFVRFSRQKEKTIGLPLRLNLSDRFFLLRQLYLFIFFCLR